MDNPLNQIITDEQFERLSEGNFLSRIKIRNEKMRQRYIELTRIKGYNQRDAIEIIQKEINYEVDFDTIRKSIYPLKRKIKV